MTHHSLHPRPLRLLIVVALAAFIAGCATPSTTTGEAAASAGEPLSLIPMPAHVERSSGHFVLRAGAPLIVRSNNAKATTIARQFAALTARTRHIQLDERPFTSSADLSGAIVLHLDSNAQAPGGEGYRLVVNSDHILVAARDPAGLYYGAVTLWQLLTADRLSAPRAIVPNVVIKDQPRFGWRGLMLDSGRHFQSVADIKKLIDWMSLHKLNVLQWHLTEDQGWRLQIKQYPKLTEIGACRKAVGPDAALTGSPDKPYCGFYTQDQVRDVVQYAARHFITIVPEIELPGHSQAALAAYPGLGVTGKRPPVATGWGISTWLYAPNEHSIQFLENVLDEVMKLFPSKYIHIGGDEAPKDQWEASSKVRAKAKKLGLDNVNDLQGWMVDQIGAYLAKHGRTLIGWDEVLQSGDLPDSAVIMSWRGVEGGIAAAKEGHDTILSPSPNLYFDYLQSHLHSEPAGQLPVMTLEEVYKFDPIPDEVPAADVQHILGIQANVWTEYIPTFKRLEHHVFPRISALAERAWSPASDRNWHGFLERMPAQLARYRALGINYADSAFAPAFKLEPGHGDTIQVMLSNQTGFGAIHYTINGGKPTPAAPAYDAPLDLNPPVKLRAATYTDAGRLLAAPRMQPITEAALFTVNSDQLQTCSSGPVLRIEDDRPLDGPRPVYRVNIGDMCWKWKGAPLDGAGKVAVTVGNLPWNYLDTDAGWIVTHPRNGQYPELDIYLDYCAGKQLAHLSLRKAMTTKLQTTLTADLPKLSRKHDLCFIITGDPRNAFWAIDTVQLVH